MAGLDPAICSNETRLYRFPIDAGIKSGHDEIELGCTIRMSLSTSRLLKKSLAFSDEA